jgi:hypothetical protein
MAVQAGGVGMMGLGTGETGVMEVEGGVAQAVRVERSKRKQERGKEEARKFRMRDVEGDGKSCVRSEERHRRLT